MPAQSFLGALCTGHGCFPPRPSSGASPDFFVNGIAALRVGDPYPAHCCGPVCHDGAVSTGSTTFFINGQPAARIGDLVSCGSAVAQGMPDFFVGD